jgi:hypothetical protein
VLSVAEASPTTRKKLILNAIKMKNLIIFFTCALLFSMFFLSFGSNPLAWPVVFLPVWQRMSK